MASISVGAEYMARFLREGLKLRFLTTTIKFNLQYTILIIEGKNGNTSITKNPTSHKISKYTDIKNNLSREQVEKNIKKLNYILSFRQLADILTKPLSAAKFIEMV